jgi:hypothetical protein
MHLPAQPRHIGNLLLHERFVSSLAFSGDGELLVRAQPGWWVGGWTHSMQIVQTAQ